MNPTADLSILTLITQASPVVQIVLAILILLSLLSWTVIFRKFFAVSRALRQTDEFESRFWSGTELTKLLEVANGVNILVLLVDIGQLDGVAHLEIASIGSTSPYIGLFGTVWGIMNAFTGLSTLENASLAVVAPGIAEALVATAIGLFAAIPAVAAYNYFNNRVGRLSNRIEGFSDEFLNILERQSRS